MYRSSPMYVVELSYFCIPNFKFFFNMACSKLQGLIIFSFIFQRHGGMEN